MADKLIGADALTRAIVNSPSDISGYNPVYCQGVAKRQIEILDIMLNMNGTTEGEIRAQAIDEFASALSNKDNIVRYDIDDLMECSGNFDLACNYLRAYVDEIAEQLKAGGKNE